jgi:hypothetical protein
MAGDGFEQMVGLTRAAPAVSDVRFKVLPPGLTTGAALALLLAPFAMVVATDFEGVAQLVQVLLRCSECPTGAGKRRGLDPPGLLLHLGGRVQLLIE